MLKKTRIAAGCLSLLAVTLLFLDLSDIARHYWGWMAKIQFIPALLSMNILAILFLIALTLLLGRVYCSVICPLGIYQDVIIRLRSWFGVPRKKQKNRFGFTPAWRRVRLTVLTCFAVLLILGLITATAAAFRRTPRAIQRLRTHSFADFRSGLRLAQQLSGRLVGS